MFYYTDRLQIAKIPIGIILPASENEQDFNLIYVSPRG